MHLSIPVILAIFLTSSHVSAFGGRGGGFGREGRRNGGGGGGFGGRSGGESSGAIGGGNGQGNQDLPDCNAPAPSPSHSTSTFKISLAYTSSITYSSPAGNPQVVQSQPTSPAIGTSKVAIASSASSPVTVNGPTTVKPPTTIATAPSASSSSLGSPIASTSSATTSGGCPAVWTQISSDLTGMFSSGGQCTDDARAAIRAIFHDCFPTGGCDGSIQFELDRTENTPMAGTIGKLVSLAQQRGVTVADMLAFAGSHAVISCPGGPQTRTLIGRKDATGPTAPNQLPGPDDSGNNALAAFQAKGFSATDLAALIGAHSCAREFNTDPSVAGASQDTTPGQWDVLYYQETLAGTAPFTFPVDTSLASQAQVGPAFHGFVGNQGAWNGAFTSAFARLQLLGNNPSSMVDCTAALP